MTINENYTLKTARTMYSFKRKKFQLKKKGNLFSNNNLKRYDKNGIK